MADDTLNGGVGATSWVGGNPSDTDPTAVQRLTAIAEWARHFSFTGQTAQVGFMEVAIPALEVGLINVVPKATEVRETETAEAVAKFVVQIEHIDGVTEDFGTIFEFGLRVTEEQVVSGAQLFNVVERKLLGVNDGTLRLFDSLHDNGNQSNPRFFWTRWTISSRFPYSSQATRYSSTIVSQPKGRRMAASAASSHSSATLSISAPHPTTWS